VLCMKSSCPNCSYRFRWIEAVRGSRCFGFVRKVVRCPGCGASVIWSRRLWRMMVAGSTIGLCLATVSMMMRPLELESTRWAALSVPAFLVGWIGGLTVRFELTEAANQHLQPTPR
jgi:hypothetical protein